MTVNNRTASRDYPKPNVANLLSEDVARLSEALDSIDTDVAALQSKAPAASPTFTGTPAAPTAAADTNTTQVATTAFVLTQASAVTPAVNGTAAVGSSSRYARADHVHPTDTTRAPVASPTFTGTPAAPTPAADTDTTQVATTAYVVGQNYTKQTRQLFTGTGLTGGGDLSANRTIAADLATQAEAEAGTSAAKLMTAQRVAQAIAAGGTLTGNLTVPSLNGGPLAGFRNRIINGTMGLNQRGSSSLSSGLSTVTYLLDRWFGFATGAAVNLSYVSTGFRVTGAASNTIALVGQRIEAANSSDLAGSTVTLSFLASSSNNASLNWRVSYASSADNYASSTTSNSGSVSTTSSVTRYSATFTLNGAATTGVQIEFFVNNFTSGTFDINGVQLEPGSVATPFEQRPIGTELALCQRYFYAPNEAPSWKADAVYSGASLFAHFYYPTTMRTAPTLTGGWIAGNNAAAGTIVTTRNLIQAQLVATAFASYSAALSVVSLSAEL